MSCRISKYHIPKTQENISLLCQLLTSNEKTKWLEKNIEKYLTHSNKDENQSAIKVYPWIMDNYNQLLTKDPDACKQINIYRFDSFFTVGFLDSRIQYNFGYSLEMPDDEENILMTSEDWFPHTQIRVRIRTEHFEVSIREEFSSINPHAKSVSATYLLKKDWLFVQYTKNINLEDRIREENNFSFDPGFVGLKFGNKSIVKIKMKNEDEVDKFISSIMRIKEGLNKPIDKVDYIKIEVLKDYTNFLIEGYDNDVLPLIKDHIDL